MSPWPRSCVSDRKSMRDFGLKHRMNRESPPYDAGIVFVRRPQPLGTRPSHKADRKAPDFALWSSLML